MQKPKPCDRYYGDGGAHTFKVVNGEPRCPSCNWPPKSHHHPMARHFHESNLIEGYDNPEFDRQMKVAWDLLMKEDVLTHGIIKKVQKILTLKQDDLLPNQRGYYRGEAANNLEVMIGGRMAKPSWMVQSLMDNWLLDYLHLSPKGAHIRFEHIHPFADGNGRTGRMLMWWSEIKVAHTEPTLIEDRWKRDYYDWFK